MKEYVSQFIIDSYGIAGWFRWIDDLDILETNTF